MSPRRFHPSVWLLLLTTLLPALALAQLPDFKQLVKANEAAVVNISTSQTRPGRAMPSLPDLPEGHPFNDFFRRFFDNPGTPRPARSLGSGFIISEDGYLLTNAHVVRDADRIVVRFRDRRELQAELVGEDPRTDVALLKVEADDLPTVAIGDSDRLEVGEWVVAIGSPFGLEHTATAGIVSAVGRNLPTDTYVPFIQTDVAVNPGNSGGPLFNLDGRVVGINAQIYSNTGGSIGLSFAIPINVAMNVADQLRETGRVTRGWLGVRIQSVDQDLAQSFGLERPRGALVSQVVDGSPAQEAGLKAGDIILEFDNQPVETMSQLPGLVGVTPVGRTVPVTLLRDGETRTVQVTIQQLEEDSLRTGGRQHSSVLGLRVADLTAQQREELGIEPDEGVLVRGVEDGPAAQAGIQPNDVILMLNHQTVGSAARFAELSRDLPRGRTVPVLVLRDGNASFLALDVPDE